MTWGGGGGGGGGKDTSFGYSVVLGLGPKKWTRALVKSNDTSFGYSVVLGLGPKKWTRALVKSNYQNSSKYQVLRPHWQDLMAHNLKQYCASAYARDTYGVPRHWESGAPENGVIRISYGDLRKHFISGNLVQSGDFWPSLGHTCIRSMCCY